MRRTSIRVYCCAALLALAALPAGCRRHQTTASPSAGPPDPPAWFSPASGDSQTAEADTPQHRPSDVLFVEYVPTPQDVVAAMLEMASVTGDDVVYDLGCGDGRIVVTAAKKYGCRAYGCDLDRLRVQEARENARKNGVDHLVTIERRDVLRVDLRDASVVALYLSPELLTRLLPQLRQLPPGSRIVSHDFPIPRIPPEKTRKIASREDGREHMIYLWTSPLPTTPQKDRPAASDRYGSVVPRTASTGGAIQS